MLIELGLMLLVQSPDRFCTDSLPHRPARDLYCMVLEPTPDLLTASAKVMLGRAPGPFGIAVTATGVQRFNLSIQVQGLPRPATLGNYQSYVAWLTPPTFDTVIKLRVVGNGEYSLGEVAFNKFLVLISAESSDTVSQRRGRLVLRGGSPGTIMLPHGASALPPRSDGAHHQGTEDGWVMPEEYPGIMPMVPGLERMRPSGMPFLPKPDSGAPLARPRQRVRLATGDTLNLTAGKVRRSVAGRSFVMYGFNGQYPGPLIDVDRQTTITVHFHNRLDQPSTVHWHGVRLDNRFDGVPEMTQDPVAPGGDFTYTLTFPDAGIYWYHPHVREDIQQDLGLYGNLLVRSEDPQYYALADEEVVLMLDDLLMSEGQPVPYGRERATHAFMGRFGNLPLVNGEVGYSANVTAGGVTRLFLTNVSNVRTWNVSIPGVRLKAVAGDLSRFEREEWVDNVSIAPAERYVIDVQFPREGRYHLVNQVQALDHQTGVYFPEVDTLATFAAAGPRHARRSDFDALRTTTDVDPTLRRYLDSLPQRSLFLTVKIDADSLPFGLIQAMRLDTAYVNPVEWSGTMPMMDWLSTSGEIHWIIRDLASGQENMDIAWKVKRGTVARIRLVNDRHTLHAMQHPIHLHGQRFLVLAQNEVPTENLVWKDTALVPAGGTLDILVEFTNPGNWMVHCHIAEHLDAGMHAMVVVE
jgi:FtsP/CotA-like multicopper oxidase with cupredoxin domain